MNQVFKGEKGSALITVLIVMGVLTVLGAALLHYSLTDNLQVFNDEKRMQAHYLARSGAEAVADYIMKNPDGADELLGKKTESVELGEGTFQVEVTKKDNGELLIESTGEVDDFERKVKLTLKPCSPFDAALFGIDGITINGKPGIDGDIATNSTEENKINMNKNALDEIKGVIKVGPGADPSKVIRIKGGSLPEGKAGNLDEIKNYSLPSFPEFPDDLVDRGSIENGRIDNDGKYSDIIVGNLLTIYTGPADEERNIRVGKLKVNGNIVIEGEGKLNLYVDQEFDLNKGSINNEDNVDALIMYYKGQNKLKITDGEFYGSIYTATGFLFSGNVIIVGNIISGGIDDKFQCTGSSSVKGNIYAPNAIINLNGNANIIGAVIAKQIKLNGTGNNDYKIEYNNDILFPFSDDSSTRNTYRIDVWSD
jgi:hypothetical protein